MIQCKLAFSLIHSAALCLTGARPALHRPARLNLNDTPMHWHDHQWGPPLNSLLHDPIMTFTYKNTLHVHLWVGHTSYSSHCYTHLSLTPHRCFFFTYIPITPLALCSVPASWLGRSSGGGPTTLHAATQIGYPQFTLTHTLKTWLILATPHTLTHFFTPAHSLSHPSVCIARAPWMWSQTIQLTVSPSVDLHRGAVSSYLYRPCPQTCS